MSNIQSEKPKNIVESQLGRKLVIFIVLMLQGVSLATSIAGAKIIFSDLPIIDFSIIKIPAYLFLGLTIQGLLLFIFFFGKKEIKSSFFRILLLIILTSASIYTSFFSIYNNPAINPIPLTKDAVAIENYNDLISSIRQSSIYQSSQNQFDQQKKRLNQAQENLKEEDVTGQAERYDQYRKERDLAQEELAKLNWVEKIKEYTKPDPDQVKSQTNTTEIKNHVESIISMLPSKFQQDVDKILSEKYDKQLKTLQNTQEYKKSYFLIPFEELGKKNEIAILALGIASFIDTISLILGISIEAKDKNDNLAEKFKNFSRNLTQVCKEFLPNLTREIGHTIFLLFQSFGSLLNYILMGMISARVRALQVFYYTPYTIVIKGNRSEFFNNLFHCIELPWSESSEIKSLLDYSKLMSFAQYNQSYQLGYRKLIHTMRDLKWLSIENTENRKLLTINEYTKLNRWYQGEKSRQFGPEKNYMSDAHDYHHIIRLPEKDEGKWWFFGWKQIRKVKFAIRQVLTG